MVANETKAAPTPRVVIPALTGNRLSNWVGCQRLATLGGQFEWCDFFVFADSVSALGDNLPNLLGDMLPPKPTESYPPRARLHIPPKTT